MKKGIRLTKNSLVVLYALFALLGASLAVLTYFRYTYAARGFVGLWTIYLFFNQGRPDRISGPIEELLQRSNKIIDFIYIFVTTLLAGWAGLQILEVYLHYVLGK